MTRPAKNEYFFFTKVAKTFQQMKTGYYCNFTAYR